MGRSKIICLVVICSIASITNAYALSPKEVTAWQEDIQYYLQQGELHHINLYHSVEEATFKANINQLISQLPELNQYQVMVELLRIARLIGDGHSAISFWGKDYKRLPFSLVDYRLDYFSRDYILSTPSEFESLLGQELIAINGIGVQAIADQIGPITQYVENQYSIAIRTKEFMLNAEILYGLGIIDNLDRVELTLVNQDGTKTTQTVEIQNNQIFNQNEMRYVNSPNRDRFSEPGFIQNDGLWVGTDTANKTAYIHFARYPSFDDMQNFGNKTHQLIRSHNIENIIIDLRDNGGGDFFIGLLLASALLPLDSINWREGVYTIIGSKVFSASMSNAAHYRQVLNARLIGSPTGANPIGYQETRNFTLPNSQFSGSFSKRLYKFQDQQSDGIRPDVEVINYWDDFKKGKDRVIEWVLNDIQQRSR